MPAGKSNGNLNTMRNNTSANAAACAACAKYSTFTQFGKVALRSRSTAANL
jgi:hypothetical protein